MNASERLFSERGYSGTSLRAIAEAAGVNVASANYHFGNKATLLAESFNRCMGPINAERLRRLEALEARDDPLALESIVQAFIEPALNLARGGQMPRLAARIFAEPKEVSIPLLERTFATTAQRFLGALARALPDLDPDDLRWRFHFLVGCLLQLNNFDMPLSAFGADERTRADLRAAGPRQLVAFAVAGLQQRSAP